MSVYAKRLAALTILVTLAVVVALVYAKGVRFPPPQFEPAAVPTTVFEPARGIRLTADGAYFQQADSGGIRLRAFAPQPKIGMLSERPADFSMLVENVHPRARLRVEGAELKEDISGLARRVSGRVTPGTKLQFRWQLPNPDTYRFTAIGDTGGGTELRWVLRRSAQLGADFVLHLGDINYSTGDLARAVEVFNTSPLPVYVAIGNHDFHDGARSVHEFFVDRIGPRNSTFALGGIRFVNLDTSVFVFPSSAGSRGRLVGNLPSLADTSSGISEYVVFTHKPLSDPRATENEGYSHSLGWLEARWLRRQMLPRGMRTLLAGHIHIANEFEDQGVKTYISGEGLAHADLIVDRPVARILVGEVAPGQSVKYRWETLDMPFATHCSPRGWEVLEALGKTDVLAQLRDSCR